MNYLVLLLTILIELCEFIVISVWELFLSLVALNLWVLLSVYTITYELVFGKQQ